MRECHSSDLETRRSRWLIWVRFTRSSGNSQTVTSARRPLPQRGPDRPFAGSVTPDQSSGESGRGGCRCELKHPQPAPAHPVYRDQETERRGTPTVRALDTGRDRSNGRLGMARLIDNSAAACITDLPDECPDPRGGRAERRWLDDSGQRAPQLRGAVVGKENAARSRPVHGDAPADFGCDMDRLETI
jgi:hypothetical protein